MMTAMRTRVTQADIAAAAGVSIPTVSAVLNRRTEGIYFSDETRDRVLTAAERLGYRANAAARQLRLGVAQVVGLAVDDLSLPFLAAVVQAAVAALRAADHACLLIDLQLAGDGATVVERCRRLHQAGRIDALLLAGATRPLGDDDVRALVASGLSTVLVERRIPRSRIPSVAVDNRAGGALAVEHLLATGRRHLGLIGGPVGNAMSDDRLAGARAACAEAGCPEPLVAAGDWGLESGRQALAALLTQRPALDAVFAANDLMAIGALAALREAGREVPRQVAVVGYDDAPIAAYVSPALTSVAQPAVAMGQAAAQQVLAALGRDAAPLPELSPILVGRESSGTRS